MVVEVVRGRSVESRHEVDVAVVDPAGALVAGWGEPTRSVLPRSAIKPVQSLPLVESGAAEALGLGDDELALACGSHGGEADHVELVSAWLARLGLGIDALECGPMAPMHRPAGLALAAEGRVPDRRHNCCSGKHAGFISACRHLDWDAAGYLRPDHRLQAELVTPAIEERCGIDLTDAVPGSDGCGIPVWAMPLDRLALGWASLIDDPAGRRLLDAMHRAPHQVAGTDRRCTELMTAMPGEIAVKVGAEAVYCGAVFGERLGIALKVRDGAERAANAAIGAVLVALGVIPADAASAAPVPIGNTIGAVVGEVRVAR